MLTTHSENKSIQVAKTQNNMSYYLQICTSMYTIKRHNSVLKKMQSEMPVCGSTSSLCAVLRRNYMLTYSAGILIRPTLLLYLYILPSNQPTNPPFLPTWGDQDLLEATLEDREEEEALLEASCPPLGLSSAFTVLVPVQRWSLQCAFS